MSTVSPRRHARRRRCEDSNDRFARFTLPIKRHTNPIHQSMPLLRPNNPVSKKNKIDCASEIKEVRRSKPTRLRSFLFALFLLLPSSLSVCCWLPFALARAVCCCQSLSRRSLIAALTDTHKAKRSEARRTKEYEFERRPVRTVIHRRQHRRIVRSLLWYCRCGSSLPFHSTRPHDAPPVE